MRKTSLGLTLRATMDWIHDRAQWRSFIRTHPRQSPPASGTDDEDDVLTSWSSDMTNIKKLIFFINSNLQLTIVH